MSNNCSEILQRTVPLLLKFLGPITGAFIWLCRSCGWLKQQYQPKLLLAAHLRRDNHLMLNAMQAHASQLVWCEPVSGVRLSSQGCHCRL
jgi:hypothetical protein